MEETKMQLVDWFDDLCVRFILNLPQEELESVERICFQIEEAQWYYEDFVRPLDPTLPSIPLKQFCLAIFQHCPLFSDFTVEQHFAAFSEFLAYKTRVPVRGAIMLNAAMDEVVLVKGWKKGSTWSFPRGKINKDEDDLDCAIREVLEETGYNIRAAGLASTREEAKYIDVTIKGQHIKLFVFRGVPKDTHFEPLTRQEISKIKWFKLANLPGYNKKLKAGLSAEDTVNANKLFMVAPFFMPLKKWINGLKRAESRYLHNERPGALSANEEGETDGNITAGEDAAQSILAALNPNRVHEQTANEDGRSILDMLQRQSSDGFDQRPAYTDQGIARTPKGSAQASNSQLQQHSAPMAYQPHSDRFIHEAIQADTGILGLLRGSIAHKGYNDHQATLADTSLQPKALLATRSAADAADHTATIDHDHVNSPMNEFRHADNDGQRDLVQSRHTEHSAMPVAYGRVPQYEQPLSQANRQSFAHQASPFQNGSRDQASHHGVDRRRNVFDHPSQRPHLAFGSVPGQFLQQSGGLPPLNIRSTRAAMTSAVPPSTETAPEQQVPDASNLPQPRQAVQTAGLMGLLNVKSKRPSVTSSHRSSLSFQPSSIAPRRKSSGTTPVPGSMLQGLTSPDRVISPAQLTELPAASSPLASPPITPGPTPEAVPQGPATKTPAPSSLLGMIRVKSATRSQAANITSPTALSPPRAELGSSRSPRAAALAMPGDPSNSGLSSAASPKISILRRPPSASSPLGSAEVTKSAVTSPNSAITPSKPAAQNPIAKTQSSADVTKAFKASASAASHSLKAIQSPERPSSRGKRNAQQDRSQKRVSDLKFQQPSIPVQILKRPQQEPTLSPSQPSDASQSTFGTSGVAAQQSESQAATPKISDDHYASPISRPRTLEMVTPESSQLRILKRPQPSPAPVSPSSLRQTSPDPQGQRHDLLALLDRHVSKPSSSGQTSGPSMDHALPLGAAASTEMSRHVSQTSGSGDSAKGKPSAVSNIFGRDGTPGSGPQTPISSADRGFLLNYLDNFVKGK